MVVVGEGEVKNYAHEGLHYKNIENINGRWV